jgi:hypothetical protein
VGGDRQGRWVARLETEAPGRRHGQGGRLSVTQAQHIRRLIVGKLPDQLKLPFYL